jgi:hypothetical protein
VTVAPLTMSMSALCASFVSRIRTGSARALICRSLPLLFGYSTTETSVIVPFATEIATCTGPQRVLAASPVTVVAFTVDPVVDPEPPAEDEAPEPPAVPLDTGPTTAESPPATACEDVDVW